MPWLLTPPRHQHAEILLTTCINSLRPRQNRCHFADDVFKWYFMNENVWIPIKLSLKSVPKGPINNIPALVQIMAWRRTGDKPLSEPMMTQFNDAYIHHSASMSWGTFFWAFEDNFIIIWREPLKFHTKYLTHSLKDVNFYSEVKI